MTDQREAATAPRRQASASQRTLAVLDALVARAAEFELAPPPPALEECRRRLRDSSYKVLVVGEAKRGKSSFVNALIGCDILPTDVDVATSQVFSIRPSQHEAYRLRFEDDSVREITAEDLSRYGSQVTIDAGIVPEPKEIIRWIEVDVAIRFLPAGVTVLDTPGLGALYAGHARITHRFVPEADAVIFVLESGQPVVEEELKFIEQILTVTNSIFFIQTKIDQFSRDDWQSVLSRNQEILAQRFVGRITDTRVWPVSSKNLRAAATLDEKRRQAYLAASRYNELAAALKAFLANVSGRGRAAEALTVATSYHATSRKALAGRLAGLTAESKQQQAELQQAATEAKRRFEAEWGMGGAKNQQLRTGLQTAVAIGKQSFANVMQPGGDIEVTQKRKLEEVVTIKQANRVAEEMPGEIITQAVNEWARICDEVQRRCVVLLGPFADAVDDIGTPVDTSRISDFPEVEDSGDKFRRDYFTALRGAAGGGMLVLGLSGMTSLIAPAATAAVMASAVMPFVAVPALLVLFGGGIRGALKGQVSQAKQQLRVRLAEQFQKTRRYFFDVDLSSGSFSRVDEYFRNIERLINEYVRDLVEKKSRESQVEIERLRQSMQLGGGDRESHIKTLQEQLAMWDNEGKALGSAISQNRTRLEPVASEVRTP